MDDFGGEAVVSSALKRTMSQQGSNQGSQMNAPVRSATASFANRVAAQIVIALLAATLSSCAPLKPYRTIAEAPVDCTPIDLGSDMPDDPSFGAVPTACAPNLIKEVSSGRGAGQGGAYELHFVEYDDQGMLYPSGVAKYGQAHQQAKLFLSDLRKELLNADVESGNTPYSVVIFVHGWKNNARSDNENVRWFRAALTQLSDVEEVTCHRKIVGAYVGWRGAGTSLNTAHIWNDLIEDTTFFSRQRAATRVGQGEIRELLARVRAIEDEADATWIRTKAASKDRTHNVPPSRPLEDQAGALCQKPVRVLIVGHSFGGRIVYTALADAMIRDMEALREQIRLEKTEHSNRPAVLQREGDVVIAISPAIEATSFVPLYRTAASDPLGGSDTQEYIRQYHTPMFVSITSYDDLATRIAYPIASHVTTLGYLYPKGDRERERRAALETLGQDQDYVSYRLMLPSQEKRRRQFEQVIPDPLCATINRSTSMKERARVELQRTNEFIQQLGKYAWDANAAEVYPRQFCTDGQVDKESPEEFSMVLAPVSDKINLNSPIWNIYTSHPILNDHSDLLNPILLDFLRQLYEEGGSPNIQLQ